MSQKRTYPSGAEKRKKKKVEEVKKCHDEGALLKYFRGTESAQSQSTSSGSTVSDESGPSPSSTVLSHTPPSSVPTVPSMSKTTADLSTTSTTTSPSHHGPSSAPPVDPAEWPSFLSDSDRTEQVAKCHHHKRVKQQHELYLKKSNLSVAKCHHHKRVKQQHELYLKKE
ncbi:uncharacterized protein LOC133657543 isoform X2 [Entelurus aequoreus]|uniref:uncharacterized protein LOC133657543 isoform X2 n=1 Tax=Entelurus aequoreus TaxID=161455 RepID=UPI002B1E3240|nr:uncharacterized protein LOC133657543 isoform X2 [Entelurus aequoreus]